MEGLPILAIISRAIFLEEQAFAIVSRGAFRSRRPCYGGTHWVRFAVPP